MNRFIVIVLSSMIIFHKVYSQQPVLSIERAQSLSSMADFYCTARNFDKAIELKHQAMNIVENIYGSNSFEYASEALTIANYYYSKGCSDSLKSFKEREASFINAINNLKISMKVVKDSLLVDFNRLGPNDKYILWQQVCPMYDRLLPCYVACCQNDSTISDLYNSVLFSKGITWRNYDDVLNADWKEIQKNLLSDEIAIEIISPVSLDEDNIIFYALILKKNSAAPYMIKLFDLSHFREALLECTTKKEKDLLIGKLVWGAIESELKGINSIYFSATHVLHNIPVEYAPLDNINYYFDRYKILRVSSTMNIINKRERPLYKRAVLYGNLEYNSASNTETYTNIVKKRAGFEALFYTKLEINEISHILKEHGIICTIFTGLSGTETSFKNLTGQDFNILHLSTHGKYSKYTDTSKYVNENNALSYSYIALSEANKKLWDPQMDVNSDGIVTAFDISKMKFKKLDLVCLSACESALGVYSDDDNILGLQKGFKVAGANTILMSLDKVDDEATKILMVEFYRNLMSGKSKHQSLKDAQKYLRQVDNGRYDKPEYWASFIMLDGLN